MFQNPKIAKGLIFATPIPKTTEQQPVILKTIDIKIANNPQNDRHKNSQQYSKWQQKYLESETQKNKNIENDNEIANNTINGRRISKKYSKRWGKDSESKAYERINIGEALAVTARQKQLVLLGLDPFQELLNLAGAEEPLHLDFPRLVAILPDLD